MYGRPETGQQVSSFGDEGKESPSDVEDIFAPLGSGEISEEGHSDGASDTSNQDQQEDVETVQRAVQDTLGVYDVQKRKRKPLIQDEAVPESQFNLTAGQMLTLCC